MNHGGARAGAGAKKTPKTRKAVSLRIRPDLADWLKDQPQTQVYLIEKALIETYGLEGQCTHQQFHVYSSINRRQCVDCRQMQTFDGDEWVDLE